MKQIAYQNIPAWASDTRTMMTIGKLLGDEPHRLSAVVTMRPDLAINMLTDGLHNTFFMDSKSKSKFTPIKAMSFEWPIINNLIPRIRIVQDTNEDGYNRARVPVYLEQKYYDKGDTFRLQNDQHLFVKTPPRRINAKCWEYTCTLAGDDNTRRINTSYLRRGRTTMYMSNYFQEMSERGYHKFMFNVEKHRGYIARHRHSGSYSSDFAVLEDVYYQHGKEYFKMEKMDSLLMNNALLTRANNLIFGKSNHDIFGKCLEQDDDGRDVPMSDGVKTQYERYCFQQRYNVLTSGVFDDAIDATIAHTGKSIGNTITAMCNRRFYRQMGHVLEEKLRMHGTDNAYYWTKNGDKVKVGAHFNAYQVQGNTIIFAVDEALTNYYPDQGYCLIMDTGLLSDGTPNISAMTLEGRQMITGTIAGLGGLDGKTSGPIATSVDGSEKHLIFYSSAMVGNPYAGSIIKENFWLN